MPSFFIKEKKIEVFPGLEATSPIICLNTYGNEGEIVYKTLKERGLSKDFTLIAISNLAWNKDMVPWDNPPTFKNGDPYLGGADEYLEILEKEIIPMVEQTYSLHPSWRGIAGYSLGGLFALYSLYRTSIFAKAASISGSLWFPHFEEYLFSHGIVGEISKLYFSLGDKESQSKNPLLATVKDKTEEIFYFYKGKGIKTIFEINPGNHFLESEKRTAKGIEWLLED